MHCSKCGFENPEGIKFCGQCTTPLLLICPKCHFQNPPGFKFCGQCTAALGAAAAKPEPSRTSLALAESDEAAKLEGERKTITVLFADIKGSMGQIEDLDPEEARAIVDPALAIMADAVNRYQGHVAQSTGDGVFALFGAPIAHEDHPQRAIYAAMRMQEELRRYSDRLRAEGKAPVEIRIGINTGEVVMRSVGKDQTHAEYLPAGHAVGLASRLQTIAPTGSIALSEYSRHLVEGYFQLKSLGPTIIKGVTEPVNVYEVLGLGPLRTRLQRSASRGLSRFVGRDAEIAQMKRALEQVKSGRGQVVAAMAEPGVGKSRLFFEFKAVEQSGCMVLEAFSISHAKASPYLPLIELLRSYFEISSEDDARKRRAKVTGNVLTLDRTLEDTLPYLFGLLGIVEGEDPLVGMDPQIRQRRILDAIKRVLLRESLSQPLIIVFEDLHWIDVETQALLNLLADSIATAKILLLVNYRPEYHHEWGSKTYYTQLRLDPLGKESADEMLQSLLQDGADLVPLKQLIADKTGGNPFFMEEMVQALFEDGVLTRNGATKVVKPLDSLRVPPTVQGILASRIDRLEMDEKELLQTVAVIGNEFQLSVVRAVTGKSDDDLSRMLNDLQLAEFIYEQPAVGEVEYIFKHALTHDVAYRSLLIERRKLLHERAGSAIERLFAAHLADRVRALARHFTESANARKAVQYLTLAGRQALERGAFAESQAQLHSGLEWVKRIGDDAERSQLELELLLVSEETLRYMRGIGSPEVAPVIRRAEQLCERAGTDSQRFSVLIGMRDVLLFDGDYEAAIEKCRLALELAEQAQNQEMLLRATAFTAHALYTSGRLAEGLQFARRALEVSRLIEEQRSSLSIRAEQIAMAAVSHTLLLLGYPAQAQNAGRVMLDAAKRNTHPSAQVAASSVAGMYSSLRMPLVVREIAEEGLTAADRSGLAWVSQLWRMRLGLAIAQLGNAEKGVALIRSGIGDIGEHSAPVAVAVFGWVGSLIEALTLASRYDEAVAAADEFMAQRSFSSSVFAPDACRLKGVAILGRDASATAEAEVCFREAIETARGNQARWWELRATVSLARLLAKQGKRDGARAMLAEIYNWFTEGFDTADLKDAKALLEELGP